MDRYLPFIDVQVDGRPVSSAFYARLNTATITDAPGQDGDTVELTFDDAGNEIQIPPEGAKLTIQFGFRDAGSWKMGSFIVEKSTIRGGADGEFVTLSGRSADARKDTKEPLSEHFDETTIGGLLGELAERHGYQAKVSDALANIELPYAARVNQSVADFLTRLADRHRALFSIKDGKFLFLTRGQLAAITIDKGMCESWDFTVEPRPRHGKTEAGWFERTTGETKFEAFSTGLEGPVKRLRTIFASQGEAKSAAEAEGDRLGRATASGSIKLAGMPEILADTPLLLTGFRAEANGAWRAGTVTHEYGETYMTSIELEAPEQGKD